MLCCLHPQANFCQRSVPLPAQRLIGDAFVADSRECFRQYPFNSFDGLLDHFRRLIWQKTLICEYLECITNVMIHFPDYCKASEIGQPILERDLAQMSHE